MKNKISQKKRLAIEEDKLRIAEESNKLEQKRLEIEEKKIASRNRMMSIITQEQSKKEASNAYKVPDIIHGVVPENEKAAIAQDSYTQTLTNYADTFLQFYGEFAGYPKLAKLTQSTDYRCVYETTASEMTREWGKVKTTDDLNDELSNKIKLIEERLKALNVKSLIRKHIENEMIFGRSQLFIDIEGQKENTDLPLLLKKSSIGKGKLKGFKLIEPMWSTPSVYNAVDPLGDDFYVPEKWYVMGKTVHANRLLTLITRPVPDLLKPMYNFSGISMIQLMEPYVERWQRNVDSISELIHSFSLTGLKTDMSAILEDGADDFELVKRAMLFSQLKDNQNLMLVNKDTEEFFQFNTPLSTLDSLMQKSQEQMAAPSHTPLVKLIGITPAGLNANSEGEIKVYYDYIAAQQENHLSPQIKVIIDVIQLDLFGEIDNSIFFNFNPLEQMSDEQKANIRKSKAETDAILIQNSVIAQEESRERLSKDEDGDYSGIDANDIPEINDGQTLEELANEAQENKDNPQ